MTKPINISFTESYTNDVLTEIMVQKYGEEVRRLVVDALQFIDQNEAGWNLDIPIDKRVYLIDLIREAKKKK